MAAFWSFFQKGDNNYGDWYPVTPSDDETMLTAAGVKGSSGGDIGPYGCRGLYVGGYATGTTPGDVVIISKNGNTATFKNVPPGTFIPCMAVYVKETSTTATSIVALL
jgi:hypothetical protein